MDEEETEIEAELNKAKDNEFFAKKGLILSRWEERWVSYQPWLESLGYRLRPRYRPGWTPSWVGSDKAPIRFEDHITSILQSRILDAERISDGAKVILKITPCRTAEIPISLYLSSGPLSSDTSNIAVPIIDVHPLPESDQEALLVTPLLHWFHDPVWETLGEVLVCIHALLEGIAFLHQQNVAHRDLCSINTMMKCSPKMFPKGFHPIQQYSYQPEGPDSLLVISLPPRTSRSIAPVRYHFIDFGEAIRFPSFEERQPVDGVIGHYLLPEFATGNPYDPFAADIGALGEMIYHEVLKKRTGIEFLLPLVRSMREKNPRSRPTAIASLSTFNDLINPLPRATLKAFLPPKPGEFLGVTYMQLRVHRFQMFLLNRPPMYTWNMEPGVKTISGVNPQPNILRRIWRSFVLWDFWAYFDDGDGL